MTGFEETGAEWGSEKQEQTKFDDLRRGITEDFQRLAKFQRILSKFQANRVFDLF